MKVVYEPVITYKKTGISSQKCVDSQQLHTVVKQYYSNLEERHSIEYALFMGFDPALNLKVIGILSMGGSTGTIVDPRVLFKKILLSECTAFALAHNHPSGSLRPSKHDIALTEKLKRGGDCLELKFIDHIIYTDAGYFSFTDNGML